MEYNYITPKVESIQPLNNYKVFIRFKTGEKKVFDASSYIEAGKWYADLADISYFNEVHIAGSTIEWPNGQDIAPEDLYYDSVPVDEFNSQVNP
jgi:hypothetical protein